MEELISQGDSKEKTLKLVEQISVAHQPDERVRQGLMREAAKLYDELISLKE
jgi:hypothetical protein